MWLLENKHDKERMSNEFASQEKAQAWLDKLGPVIGRLYRVVSETGNAKVDRMLTEGLIRNDLQNILLPLISIDEYVPADPGTDNVVVGFFIKGVPEAVLPFKSFAEKSNGVLSADYGDSNTIVNTSIVYVEFDRENLELEDIHALVVQAGMLAGLESEDFTMTFPHTTKKFPYEIQLINQYFVSRNAAKNRAAQRKAELQAQKEIEGKVQRAQADRAQQQEVDRQATESLIEHIAGLPVA